MINLNYDMEFKKKLRMKKNSQLKNFSESIILKNKKNSTISEK